MPDHPIHPLLGEAGVCIDARFEMHATDISNLAERLSNLEDRVDDADESRARAQQATIRGVLHQVSPFVVDQADRDSRDLADRREAAFRVAEGLQ